MITLPSARRRADELAAALEDPSTLSDQRPDLVELVEVAAALRAHQDAVVPHPSFSATLRERLMAEAAETWAHDPAAARLQLRPRSVEPGSRRRERRLVVAATAAVLVGGTAGMAAAAQDALPGEALYPVKRGIESVRTDLASTDAAKGQSLLAQADGRLVEVRELLEGGAPAAGVAGTIETYTEQASGGADLLLRSYAETGDEQAVNDVRGFTEAGMADLAALTELAPPELADELQAAATALQEIDALASDACPTCGSTGALALPVSFRPAAEASRVLAGLRADSLSNNHPLISNRVLERGRDGAAAPRQGDAVGGEQAGGPELGDDLTELPDLPDLGGVDTSAPGPADGQGDGLGDGLGDLGDDLEDAGRTATDSVREGVRKGGDAVDRVTEPLRRTVRDTTDATDPLLDPLLP